MDIVSGRIIMSPNNRKPNSNCLGVGVGGNVAVEQRV